MAGDSAPPTAPSFDAEALAGFHEPAGEAEASFAEGPDSIAALAAMLDPAETGGGRTLVVPVTRGYAAVGVAVALGRHVAADGRRAALVDLDAEGRALSALLPPGAAGLGDFAEGRAGFGAILHADPASSAHIVPFGAGAEADPDTADFVVEALARSYDSVVIAAGLLPPEPEAFDRLAALASDAVVVAETSASDPRVVSAFERLRGAGLRPVVVMLAADEAVAAA